MDGDDARRNPASASQESSLCRPYGFDSSGNLGGGQVRIGKGAAQAKEPEEAEEAQPKIDPHGVTLDTFCALHEPQSCAHWVKIK
jgi:hypothetical protein